MSTETSPYKGREQTEIKHLILKKYLEGLAYKAGSYQGYNHRLCYVDCFAGPWNSATEDMSDTSPSIAITELLKAKNGLMKKRSIDLTLKAMFIEKTPVAFQQLEPFFKSFPGITTHAVQGEFQDNVQEILKYVGKDFTFFFIDPLGWKGFGMKSLSPVLNHRPGEVLINFMTDYIIRFVDSNQDEEGFIDLFGSSEARKEWESLSGLERESKIVQTYCKNLQKTSRFTYVVSAIILYPTSDRTYFHLIYATSNNKGLEVFREVEKKAMAEHEKKRGELKQKKQELPLLALLEQTASETVPAETNHFVQLRRQHLLASKNIVIEAIKNSISIDYEALKMIALANTLTWLSDLQEWLQEWEGHLIVVEGKTPRQRTVQAGHIIKWIQN